MIQIPFTATIIAHEKMDAFAYISILEAILKLAICYAILISPYDRLIVYALLLSSIALIIRAIYGVYCSKNFEECYYRLIFNKPVLKEMSDFAGWSFFTNSAYALENLNFKGFISDNANILTENPLRHFR